jgi:hypothetical protein
MNAPTVNRTPAHCTFCGWLVPAEGVTIVKNDHPCDGAKPARCKDSACVSHLLCDAYGRTICFHRNIHPARVDGCHTSCLDCGAHVIVETAQYASGQTPAEDAAKMRAQCDAAHPIPTDYAPSHQTPETIRGFVNVCYALVQTIEATGGIEGNGENDDLAPCGDPEWVDLASAYLTACTALDVDPLVNGKREKGEKKS